MPELLTPNSTPNNKPSNREDNLPNVFWHTGGKQWASKIGYWLLASKGETSAPGKRDRAYQYLGKNQSAIGKHDADDKAIQIKKAWDQLVSDWPTVHRPQLESHLPDYDWEKPIWLHHKFVQSLHAKLSEEAKKNLAIMEKVSAKMVEWDQQDVQKVAARNPEVIQKLVTPLGTLKVDEASAGLAEAKERYLDSMRNRTTLKKGRRIKGNSFNNVKTGLEICIKPFPIKKIRKVNDERPANEKLSEAEINRIAALKPIEINKRLVDLTRADLEYFVNYWWSEWNGLKPRTAKNYCGEFKKFLDWCAEREEPEFAAFVMPKGANKLFNFPKTNPINIAKYDPQLLIALRKNGSKKTYLYHLLGFAGLYQGDIAHLRVDEIVRLVNGEIVSLTYEQLKTYDGSYDAYVHRRRDRTDHKVDDRQKSLIWLFPETVKLVARYLAPQDNQYGYAMLNEDGLPLVKSAVEESHIDAIQSCLKRAIKKAKKEVRATALEAGKTVEEANDLAQKFKFTMKQFRKVGATAVAAIATTDSDVVARLYRSQPPDGDAKFYVADDYEKKLTPVLKLWAEKLRTDEVLVEFEKLDDAKVS